MFGMKRGRELEDEQKEGKKIRVVLVRLICWYNTGRICFFLFLSPNLFPLKYISDLPWL